MYKYCTPYPDFSQMMILFSTRKKKRKYFLFRPTLKQFKLQFEQRSASQH